MVALAAESVRVSGDRTAQKIFPPSVSGVDSKRTRWSSGLEPTNLIEGAIVQVIRDDAVRGMPKIHSAGFGFGSWAPNCRTHTNWESPTTTGSQWGLLLYRGKSRNCVFLYARLQG